MGKFFEILWGPSSRVCTGALLPPLCSRVWGRAICISPSPLCIRKAVPLLRPEGGESPEHPVTPRAGAGEGAPLVIDTSEGSAILPLRFCLGRERSLFFLPLYEAGGGNVMPAFGSRSYLCESQRKAAQACRRGDEGI